MVFSGFWYKPCQLWSLLKIIYSKIILATVFIGTTVVVYFMYYRGDSRVDNVPDKERKLKANIQVVIWLPYTFPYYLYI